MTVLLHSPETVVTEALLTARLMLAATLRTVGESAAAEAIKVSWDNKSGLPSISLGGVIDEGKVTPLVKHQLLMLRNELTLRLKEFVEDGAPLSKTSSHLDGGQ